MAVAALVGIASAMIGLYLSYWLDVASGATIVLVQTGMFLLAMVLGPRGMLARRRAVGRGARGRRVTAAEALVAALDDAGLPADRAAPAVADLVAAREGHFTAADLVDDARRRRLRIGRATIFRALDVFADLRLVERVDLPDGEHAYVGCDPVHHHHAICTRCGRSQDIDDLGLERRAGRRSGTGSSSP